MDSIKLTNINIMRKKLITIVLITLSVSTIFSILVFILFLIGFIALYSIIAYVGVLAFFLGKELKEINSYETIEFKDGNIVYMQQKFIIADIYSIKKIKSNSKENYYEVKITTTQQNGIFQDSISYNFKVCDDGLKKYENQTPFEYFVLNKISKNSA